MYAPANTVTALTAGCLALTVAMNESRAVDSSDAQAAVGPSIAVLVHYGEDRINGTVPVSEEVTVTVRDAGAAIKATAVVSPDPSLSFFVEHDEQWSPGPPDIVPGDSVTAVTATATGAVEPVGEIRGSLDFDLDTISGQVQAAILSAPFIVRCEAGSNTGGWQTQDVVSDGAGNYLCNLALMSWDLLPTDLIYVSYFEPDGDQVSTRLGIRLEVNYYTDHLTGTASEAPVTVQLTDSGGTLKATASPQPERHQQFQVPAEAWEPAFPDIMPGDRVLASTPDNSAQVSPVGQITGTIDVAADAITGTVTTPISPTTTLELDCYPLGAWQQGLPVDPIHDTVPSDGSGTYTCDWSGIWDIVPGQPVAVYYNEPDGDRVGNEFQFPAPRLQIEMDASGMAAPGGGFRYRVYYRNSGDGAAENVQIIDTLPLDFTYAADTSGFAVTLTATDATWDLGTLLPGEDSEFFVYLDVGLAASGDFTNLVEIQTTSFDTSEPHERMAEWTGSIVSNDTHLAAQGLHTEPPDPHPGEHYTQILNVCNNGPTGSTDVTLTLTIPLAVSIDNWSSPHPGWYEMSNVPGEMVLWNPGLNGFECADLYVLMLLDAATPVGTVLHVEFVIVADNDLETEDNVAANDFQVGPLRPNLRVTKDWVAGQWAPGQQLHYWITTVNDGNKGFDAILISDALPPGTLFRDAWWDSPTGPVTFVPDAVDDHSVTWQVEEFLPGRFHGFNVLLDIEGDAPADTMMTNLIEACAGELPAGCQGTPLEQRYDDNVASASVVLRDPGPNLRVRKHHNWHGPQELGYWIWFGNIGTESLFNVEVADTLPVGTGFPGHMMVHFHRPVAFSENAGVLTWAFDALHPGEMGWLEFNASVDQPGIPLQWFTNVVSMTAPPADVDPSDNAHTDVAFSGGEVFVVHLDVATDHAVIFGQAQPNTTVRVEVGGMVYEALADPPCGGCWHFDDVGSVQPGDTLSVAAGAQAQPVNITVPPTFNAETDGSSVSGVIGGLDTEIVEAVLDGLAPRFEHTDATGHFDIEFFNPDNVRHGLLSYETQVDYAQIIFHREVTLRDQVFGDGFEELP